MLTSTTLLTWLSVCALAVAQEGTTGKLGDAPKVTENPAAAYEVKLEAGDIKGWAKASSEAGKPVSFEIEIEGLPADKGPFSMLEPKHPI